MARQRKPVDWSLYTFRLDELPFLAAKYSSDSNQPDQHEPSHDEPTPASRSVRSSELAHNEQTYFRLLLYTAQLRHDL